MNHAVRFLAGLALLGACTGDPSPTENSSANVSRDVPPVTSPAQLRDLAALRAAVAPYHRLEAASQPGLWDTQFPAGCFTSADGVGAMGYHFIKHDNVGTLEVTRPQLLMFEPDKNGQRHLVGVEYIVPGADTDPAPVLFEQSFHYNHTFNVWVLHVWAFTENPRGIYQDWNPRVSCQYAAGDVVQAAVGHH